MSLLIPQAAAQASGAAPQGGNPLSMIIIFGGFFLFMYFFMIRPQRKRQKEHKALIDALSKGDEIVLNSGMLGKITKVDDTYVTLDAGNNVELKYQKIAVHAVLPKGTIKSV